MLPGCRKSGKSAPRDGENGWGREWGNSQEAGVWIGKNHYKILCEKSAKGAKNGIAVKDRFEEKGGKGGKVTTKS